jgi:hypothetical protein
MGEGVCAAIAGGCLRLDITGEQDERHPSLWSHHTEIPFVHGQDALHTHPLRRRHHRHVGQPRVDVPILRDQLLRRAVPCLDVWGSLHKPQACLRRCAQRSHALPVSGDHVVVVFLRAKRTAASCRQRVVPIWTT